VRAGSGGAVAPTQVLAGYAGGVTETPDQPDATRLLAGSRAGDGRAQEDLLALLYSELRGLAQRLMQGERVDHTLQATALVNEAWMRLVGAEVDVASENRAHFLRLAGRTMRRVLVDHARGAKRDKRGGGRTLLSLGEREPAREEAALDVLELEEALARLEEKDAELARVVELRFFAGLSLEETASVLGVTEDAVRWSWKLARGFLRRELERGGSA